jgi:hypothetical protein
VSSKDFGAYDVVVPATIRHQSSPLLVLCHEFLQTEEMSWMREVDQPLRFEKWLLRYPVVRQRQLTLAREKVELGGLLRKHAAVDNFIKVETTTNLTDPRNISPRLDEFMSVAGPYIAAVEHRACKAPFLVKGVDLKKRDQKMQKLLAYESFIEIDYSRFDATISVEMLEIEREMILSQFKKHLHPEIHQIYDMMLKTRAQSRLNTEYSKEGGRNSGDLTTSIGNGLLNRFAVWFCLRKVTTNYVSYHEGDDGVIGCMRADLPAILECLNFLWVLGFQGKIDVYHSLDQVSFCGRFLCVLPGGLSSYADPWRTMAKIHTTCSSGPGKELMCAKMLSYAFTDGDTPVIGEYARAAAKVLLREIGVSRLSKRLHQLLRSNELPWFYTESLRGYSQARLADHLTHVVTSRTTVNDDKRGAFAFRTGISLDQQLWYEGIFRSWVDHITEFPPFPRDWTIKAHVEIN